MANYVTNTSDKSRKKAIKLLLIGGLGFHLFYVGRIIAGIIRFAICLFMWLGFLGGLNSNDADRFEYIAFCLIVIGLFNLTDLIKLLLGTFKDNVGNYLRE